MKVVHNVVEDDGLWDEYYCPNCGRMIMPSESKEKPKHCVECGQKLEWGDKE